jgi:hypothetical protein
MIETSTETLLSLRDAAKRLPGRRQGKRPAVETLYRWTLHGCRGIVLESAQIGGTRCTSIEALDRFFAALSAASRAGQLVPPPLSTARMSAARRRQVEQAERELTEAGI